MQNDMSELARKYQEEMLRLYGKRRPEPVAGSKPPPGLAEDPSQVQFDEEVPEEVYGDAELPVYIRPVPELPAEWTAQAAYEERNTAEGYLRVITAAADSAYPVKGARVSVFTRIGKKLHLSYLMVTDENGESPTVALPAPPAGLSQEPENQTPYASCDIRIAARGFFPTQASDVHIFAGVTTRQVFQLVPLPVHYEASDSSIDPNGSRSNGECQGGASC